MNEKELLRCLGIYLDAKNKTIHFSNATYSIFKTIELPSGWSIRGNKTYFQAAEIEEPKAQFSVGVKNER